MLFVIYLAWMSPTYCNSRQNVFDAYDGEIKLRRSLANCPSTSVCREIADIQYNIPELFVD
jgi:hypothetical protein